MSLDADKTKGRDRARALRKRLAAAAGDDVPRKIAQHAFNALNDFALPEVPIVAGYWPLGSEADGRYLMKGLVGADVVVGLPVVQSASTPLLFRRWRFGDDLVDGTFGTRQPAADKEVVSPNVVLTPLLAFDGQGYRLGQGGGYYDRTVQALRAANRIVVIGIAFAGQETENLPHDENDQRLDWVVTETGVRRFNE